MKRRLITACIQRVFGCLLLLFLFIAPVGADANEEGEAKKPAITFGKLLIREAERLDVAVGKDSIGVNIIEHLRSKGYNAVGAENLLFGEDHSSKANLVLGGTLNELECSRRGRRAKPCNISVQWELYDKREKAVVYKVLTWYRETVPLDSGAYRLVLGSLDKLLGRPMFNEMVNRIPVPTRVEYADASFRKCERQDLFLPSQMEKVLDASFMVEKAGGFGSGFMISPDGLALTAAHVVEGHSTCKVVFKSGFSLTATVLRVDPDRDVALLSIPMQDAPCLPVRAPLPGVGEKVFAIGAPADPELAFSVSSGIVSGVRETDHGERVQTDAAVSPGNSGGPLVDEQGNAVAVMVTKKVSIDVEGISFAVPGGKALEYLAMKASEKTDKISTNIVQGASKPEFPVVDTPDEHPIAKLRRIRSLQTSARLGSPLSFNERIEKNKFFYSRGRIVWFSLSVGAIAIGSTVGTLSYLSYQKDEDEGRWQYKTQSQIDDEFNRLKIANAVGWGVAGLGVVNVIVFLFTGRKKERISTASLDLSFGATHQGAFVAGRF